MKKSLLIITGDTVSLVLFLIQSTQIVMNKMKTNLLKSLQNDIAYCIDYLELNDTQIGEMAMQIKNLIKEWEKKYYG